MGDGMTPIGDLMKFVADNIAAQPTERTEECPKHGAFTSRSRKFFEGGRIHWSKCPECSTEVRAAEEAAEAARKAAAEAKRIEERLNRAGIPRLFRTRTLASFEAETAAQKKALAIATDFADNFPQRYVEGASLIFAGLPGTGKSHLACAIANQILLRWTAIYIPFRDMLVKLRATWRQDSPISEDELQRIFVQAHLLIVDEIGVQFGTEAERNQLFNIIDARYREQRPIILLTNCDADGFKTAVGQRAFDRFRECAEWVPYNWESYRGRRW